MKLEISRREYQISRERKVWTKHSLLSCIEATDSEGRWQYLTNLALKWNLKSDEINRQILSNKLSILSTVFDHVSYDLWQ